MAGKTTGFAGKRRCDRRMTRGLPAVERKICTTALRPLSQQSMPPTAMIWAPARTSPTNGDPSVTPVTCSNAWGGKRDQRAGSALHTVTCRTAMPNTCGVHACRRAIGCAGVEIQAKRTRYSLFHKLVLRCHNFVRRHHRRIHRS